MGVCVIAMTLASAAVWSLMFGWPPAMALLASVPGSMSYIVTVSLTMGADAAKVASVWIFRWGALTSAGFAAYNPRPFGPSGAGKRFFGRASFRRLPRGYNG